MARTPLAYLRPVVFVLCLLPASSLVWGAFAGSLGANPIEAITHGTGEWALRLLLLTLSLTPAARLTGRTWLMGLRRMLGLFAFFYAGLHLVTYLWLDQFFMWGEILADIIERPFITLGMGAFMLMVPLAATSTRAMMRRLGRRWKTLHRLVYVSAALAVLHFLWLVKADLQRPLFYAVMLGLLLGFRFVVWGRGAFSSPRTASHLAGRE